MRTYPQDSPQAAARIVAMAALADGHMCNAETERLLNQVGVSQALGLTPSECETVLRAYCEDVLLNSPLGWCALSADAPMIAVLLGEIQDLALRRTVIDLCVAVAEADAHRAPGESIVLEAAAAHWGLAAKTSDSPDPRALTGRNADAVEPHSTTLPSPRPLA